MHLQPGYPLVVVIEAPFLLSGVKKTLCEERGTTRPFIKTIEIQVPRVYIVAVLGIYRGTPLVKSRT